MTMGEYLNWARTQKGYSIRELSEKSQISTAEISRLESGKRLRPSPGVLKALAEALSIDYSTLMQMAGYIEEKANEIGVPMVFTVVDEGGNLVYFQRMPGSLLISIKVSQDKAYTAVSLKCPTAALADVTKPGDSLWSLHNSGDGRIICFGGGYPIEVDGKVIGAIGVSGGTAEEDMSVATYALEKMRGGNA